MQRFLTLFRDQFGKAGFARSMLSAYTAVLSSPGFVFIDEKPGQLDDYALGHPARALPLEFRARRAAARAREPRANLSQPDVLRAADRAVLNDPKSRRFVDAFTDYWLDLRKIDDTSPSTTLYNDYELDDPLKLAASRKRACSSPNFFQRSCPREISSIRTSLF